MTIDLPREDRKFLTEAVRLGRRGWGRVHPNPMVGCVLVRHGEVVGVGWHEEYGGPHAEVNALRQAGDRAVGATAFVSLEPCNHFGRTPPCSTALREAGVGRVVFGWEDPGRVSGGGGAALKSAGVEVLGPALPRELGRRENPVFFHNAEHESPYLALKLAQTLDGRIAEAPGKRTDITGPEVRSEVQRLRAGFDGILVGSGTVAVDDPLLTVREPVPMRKPPVRMVLDTRSRISPTAKLFQDIADVPVIVFTRDDVSELTIQELEAAGAQVHPVPGGPGGVSLDSVLDVCWEKGIHSLFCEGGGRLASSILRQRKAQRLFLFVAPFVLGEKGVPAFPGLAGRELWEGWTPGGPLESFGGDVLMTFDHLS